MTMLTTGQRVTTEWGPGTVTDSSARRYRILPGPMFGARHLATAPARARLEDAVADMGTGVVVDWTGEIVAFHESHLPAVERLAQLTT